MTPAGHRTLPDLDAPFSVPGYVLDELKQTPNAFDEFSKLPELYVRVRVGFIRRDANQAG